MAWKEVSCVKKIIIFIDNLGSGGAQRQAVNLAGMLKAQGYDVSVLVYDDLPFYQSHLDERNIPTVLIKSPSSVRRLFAVRRYLRRSGADVVITFLETPGFIGCFSKMGGARWKLITSERSAQKYTFTNRRHRFYNWFERFADAKVCNSENGRLMWRKYYPQWSEKYHTIYNPVVVPPAVRKMAEEHKKSDRLVIAVAASYQGLKNPLRVITAVSRLTQEQRDKLQINWYGRAEVTTGNTAVYDRAVSMVEQYHLEDCVRLNHETDDIYTVMANSDVVGLFSTVEGLPNAICEGMTLGKPIVMSCVSDFSILVEDNGVLCDPKSVDSIRDTLAFMLSLSDERLKEMGIASRRKALELFMPDVICDRWVSLIETLTEK